MGTSTEVVEFRLEHLDSIVSSLMRVQSSDSNYPPRREVAHSTESLSDWLFNVPVLGRWTALVGGEAVGHIVLREAPDYVKEFLYGQSHVGTHKRGMAEIGKFFVDPRYQNHGIGDLLFQTACTLAEDLLMQPGLSVVSSSEKAVRFYTRHDMHKVGHFTGFHGVDHSYFVK